MKTRKVDTACPAHNLNALKHARCKVERKTVEFVLK